jgi:uncharacterized protein with PQ loop repeat
MGPAIPAFSPLRASQPSSFSENSSGEPSDRASTITGSRIRDRRRHDPNDLRATRKKKCTCFLIRRDLYLEIAMQLDPMVASVHRPDAALRRLLGGMSIFTMLMTIPQVLTIWVGQQAAGVSLLSWGAYLVSALLWFWFGIRKGDKNIYLACVGWIVLDVAVIVGVILYG